MIGESLQRADEADQRYRRLQLSAMKERNRVSRHRDKSLIS